MPTEDGEAALERAIQAAEKEVRETSERLHEAARRVREHASSARKCGTPPRSSPASSPLGVRQRGLLGLAVQEEPASPLHVGKPIEEREPISLVRLGVVGVVVAIIVVLEHMVSSGIVPPPSNEASTIDAADTAWMLVATMSVLLMTYARARAFHTRSPHALTHSATPAAPGSPALGLFEAGLLRAKNSVSVLMQCFAGLAGLSVLWFFVGFSLCFSPSNAGLLGSPTTYFLLTNVPWDAPLPAAPTIPGVLFAAFQGMFAAITPLLCTGAFAERLRFEAFLVFIILWSLAVYYPLCHWVWGGGWLSRLGVVDFAGGIVIHTAAGAASLVTAVKLGPRRGFTGVVSGSLAPHNLPMAATGAGLLWVGWFGFNAGSAVASGALAASTLLTTHIAGATGTLAWLVLDWIVVGRPTFVGVINGALSGLAGVTPASGFVAPSAGLVIGMLCGVASYGGVHLLKERLRVDDALDVSSIHGVTGVVGSLLLGLYASSAVNPGGPDGSVAQLLTQAIGVAVAAAWSASGTYLVMAVTECLVATRIDEDDESRGLDRSQHGESSYLDLHALV